MLVPDQWAPDREYEDDYCYAEILHQLLHEELSQTSIEKLFKRYDDWLDGEVHTRLDVCRAIADKNQTAFEEAFTLIISERELQIENNKARGQLEDPQVLSQRQIYIEGLALLRLAELKGLETQSEYQYCPSIARIPMQTPFPDE